MRLDHANRSCSLSRPAPRLSLSVAARHQLRKGVCSSSDSFPTRLDGHHIVRYPFKLVRRSDSVNDDQKPGGASPAL